MASATMMEQLRDQQQRLTAAVLRRDMAEVASWIADDALFHVCKRLLRGKPAITAYLTSHLGDLREMLVFDASWLKVEDTSDLAFGRGAILERSSVPEMGAYELILRRGADNSWKVVFAQVVTTTSARASAAASAAPP